MNPASAKAHLEEAVRQARTGELRAFHDLARTSGSASAVADSLPDLLDDADPNVRLGAARALGYAGRSDLGKPLVLLLSDHDWRVVHATCLSLARLEAKDALASLKALSTNHWYPRVRNTAKYASQKLEGFEPAGTVLSSAAEWNRTDRSLLPLGEKAVAKLKVARTNPGFLPWDRSPNWPASTRIETFRTRHPELYAAIAAGKEIGAQHGWLFYCRITGIIGKSDTTLVALRAGEYIGGLFAIKEGTSAGLITDQDVFALIPWGDRLMAIVGLEHMGMDRGAVYELVARETGWTAEYRFALPGCPDQQAGILPDGRLFANCMGGAVAISKDGRFTYLGGGSGGPGE